MKKFSIFLFLSFALISCQKKHREISKIIGKTIQIDTLTQQDSSIIHIFSPYKTKMIEEITKVLSFAPKNLVRTDGNLQSSLGNLIADLSYEKAATFFEKETGKKVDFHFSNYGGIRASIWKGNVTVSNAFELMPFDNTLVVVELSAQKTKELFQYFIEQNKAHPISQQVTVIINGNDHIIKIKDELIDDRKTYFVATSDYLQKGGDNMVFFKNPINLYKSDFLVRDAIIEYFKSKDTLISKLDNRVIVTD